MCDFLASKKGAIEIERPDSPASFFECKKTREYELDLSTYRMC